MICKLNMFIIQESKFTWICIFSMLCDIVSGMITKNKLFRCLSTFLNNDRLNTFVFFQYLTSVKTLIHQFALKLLNFQIQLLNCLQLGLTHFLLCLEVLHFFYLGLTASLSVNLVEHF